MNFYNLYSSRYFFSENILLRPSYFKPINLVSFSLRNCSFLCSHFSSSFKNSIKLNFFGPNYQILLFCQSTKFLIPISYLYIGLQSDFSWFIILDKLTKNSKRIFLFAPFLKLAFSNFSILLNLIFFASRIRNFSILKLFSKHSQW